MRVLLSMNSASDVHHPVCAATLAAQERLSDVVHVIIT